jgi:hypothetical protein
MKVPPADDLRRVLCRLPMTLLLGMLLWAALRPALDGIASTMAEVLVRAYEVPRVTRLVSNRHWVEVRRSDSPPSSSLPSLPLTGVHFNTVVLLALALALPRPWSRRQVERLAMAWMVLLLTQALNLVFEVKSLYATRCGAWSLENYTPLARDLFGFLQVLTDLPLRFAAPFVVWYGFNADVVSGLIGGGEESGTGRGGERGARPQRPRRR